MKSKLDSITESNYKTTHLYSSKFPQETSNIKEIICPYCKINTPIISKISTSNNKEGYFVNLSCKCLKYSSQKKIDLYKYILFLSSLNNKNTQCFKHRERKGITYCKQCCFYMCSTCYSYHIDFEKNHQAIIINNINDECPIHPEIKKNFFCEKCNANICIECIKLQHHNHKVINLKEYWENINQKLKFHTIEELKYFLLNENKNYDLFIKEEIENIDKIILSLKKIKQLIEQIYTNTMVNNGNLFSFIIGIYFDFFRNKHLPKYNSLQNVKKIMLNNFINKDDRDMMENIFTSIHKNFEQLTKMQNDFANRVILKEIDVEGSENIKIENEENILVDSDNSKEQSASSKKKESSISSIELKIQFNNKEEKDNSYSETNSKENYSSGNDTPKFLNIKTQRENYEQLSVYSFKESYTNKNVNINYLSNGSVFSFKLQNTDNINSYIIKIPNDKYQKDTCSLIDPTYIEEEQGLTENVINNNNRECFFMDKKELKENKDKEEKIRLSTSADVQYNNKNKKDDVFSFDSTICSKFNRAQEISNKKPKAKVGVLSDIKPINNFNLGNLGNNYVYKKYIIKKEQKSFSQLDKSKGNNNDKSNNNQYKNKKAQSKNKERINEEYRISKRETFSNDKPLNSSFAFNDFENQKDRENGRSFINFPSIGIKSPVKDDV